jgi:hypothetical protein
MSQRKAPTSDRIRQEIDHGRAGDKKGFPDPAAAPMGTDAEAGGASPTPQERDMAYQAEIARRPDGPAASGARRPVPVRQDDAHAARAGEPTPVIPSALIFIGIIAAVGAIMLAAWLL